MLTWKKVDMLISALYLIVMTVIYDECVTELPHSDASFCNQAKGHKLGVTLYRHFVVDGHLVTSNDCHTLGAYFVPLQDIRHCSTLLSGHIQNVTECLDELWAWDPYITQKKKSPYQHVSGNI
jgi:hypothetical protein